MLLTIATIYTLDSPEHIHLIIKIYILLINISPPPFFFVFQHLVTTVFLSDSMSLTILYYMCK